MTFLEILTLLVITALLIIAIRISFKFDINRFLENRRKIKLDQMKNICPHGHFLPHEENTFLFESYFLSPAGTTRWICSQCSCIVESEEDIKRISEMYSQNPFLV